MGILFPNLEVLERTAYSIDSNMFEGFEPSQESIALIRDYILDKITLKQFVEKARGIANG